MVICVILNYSVLIVKIQEFHIQFNLSDMSRSLHVVRLNKIYSYRSSNPLELAHDILLWV